mmetsp:Transcript_72033/g.139195  ORF Transcript_72033/g.139195 Transcript_72033/m.139195 type:complete len:638 (-) Transcript_72033:1-1914(-)
MAERDAVVAYLEGYGYEAVSLTNWETQPVKTLRRPTLRLAVGGHDKQDSHTLYNVQCCFAAEPPKLPAEWTAPRRLVQLREELHDKAKVELGQRYVSAFAQAPFAKRGGPSGTTERLHKWVETLAGCVNDGVAPPVLVSQVLQFFDAPTLEQTLPFVDEHHNTDNSEQGEHLEDEKRWTVDIAASDPKCTEPWDAQSNGVSPARQSVAEVQDCLLERDAGAHMAHGSTNPFDADLEVHATSNESLPASPPPQPTELPPASQETPGQPDGLAEQQQQQQQQQRVVDRGSSPAFREQSGLFKTDGHNAASPNDVDATTAESGYSDGCVGPLELPQTPTSRASYGDPADMVALYLRPYGYAVTSPEQWCVRPCKSTGKPTLRLHVTGHTELESHTFYSLQCLLTAEDPSARLEWTAQRRLVQLREELHEAARNELGGSYLHVFSKAPFAKRGGRSGTTSRLQVWLETLAASINTGKAPPALVAQVLLFLDAPAQSAHRSAAAAAADGNMSGSNSKNKMGGTVVVRKCRKDLHSCSDGDAAGGQQRSSKEGTGCKRVAPQSSCTSSSGEDQQATNDEGTYSLWSAGMRRRRGYRKLREWFADLRRKLDMKLKREMSTSPPPRMRERCNRSPPKLPLQQHSN